MKRFGSFLLTALFVSQTAWAADSVRLDGRSYVPAEALTTGLEYDWDPQLENATFSSGKGRIRFHAGSDRALESGRLVRLSERVLYRDGRVFLPAADARRVEWLAEKSVQAPPVSAPARRRDDRVRPVPSAPAAVPARHRVLRVVVDAGHGGHDSGAVSRRGTREKDITLDVARRLAKELDLLGFDVVMTRRDDRFIELDDRAAMASAADADLFVSIHANASTTPALRGFETYTLSEEADDAHIAERRAEGSRLAKDLPLPADASPGVKALVWDLVGSENRRESEYVSQKISESVAGGVETGKRRQKDAQFRVLKWTECPSVLVECGYLTNREDERFLMSPLYREKLAKAIAEGVLRYKKAFEETRGFTE